MNNHHSEKFCDLFLKDQILYHFDRSGDWVGDDMRVLTQGPGSVGDNCDGLLDHSIAGL